MSTKWFIDLAGDEIDLKRLAEAFAEPPVTIAKEGERYRLCDESLGDPDDAESVRAVLRRTLSRINAVARLHLGKDHHDVTLGPLCSANDDGVVTWHDSGTVVARARFSAHATIVGPDGQIVPPPPSLLPMQVQLAASDPSVDDALYFLQRADADWVELYKAYEIVRSDVGKIAECGWVSKRELSRFTGTANHPDAAGPTARHARTPYAAPPDPMTLQDARALMGHVVRAWITAKAQSLA